MKKQKITTSRKVGALIASLFIPGVGSFLVKKNRRAWWQLGVWLFGMFNILVLGWFLIGLVTGPILCTFAWIWALVTSIIDLTEE
jgi:hypothetical protein